MVTSSFAAHLHTGELVAVKVQRPGMSLSLTLDALLFNMIGGQLKRFAKARKDIIVAVNETVSQQFQLILGILTSFVCLDYATTVMYLSDDYIFKTRLSEVSDIPEIPISETSDIRK